MGCGAEDFELGKREQIPTLVPVDEAGHFTEEYGWLAGMATADAAEPITAHLQKNGVLVRSGSIDHRFPVCWRCGTELIQRVVDE